MKRRLLSLLLVFVMLLGLMPTTALAVTNGSGTQQSPLSVTTYEELKAALADDTTLYIVVNEFETNYDDGNSVFYQINQAIDEDYALYSNPVVDKHLTINTAVRISTSVQCTNVKTGLEVGGNLTIDGTGIFNMSFYGTESRCVVVNVPKSGKLIVNGQVTIDATSVWQSDEINQEVESIHSNGHIVFNGGTFIGYFSRVSSTMGSVYAVYVEVGRSEYYGGNFKTVNHSAVDNGVQIDKGCEGGVILINRPSANGTKKVPELTKLKGGTFQSIVIVNYENTSDLIGNLLVGCRLYDADDKHELDEYYALNYVHNVTVLKYNLDITFDANGGKGLMKKVTFNTLLNDYFTLPESGFYAPKGKRFKCWSIDGIEKAVGETFEPTKDTVISAVWVDIPANELGGKGTQESPLYVNTYAELKAALADDVTEYIVVKDFLYTNDGGYHLINNPIDGEDYALWSNPDIHKHLTIDTKVRLGVYLACPNITKGIEVAGKLTIDGSGSFNTSFLSNKRGTVINVTSTGTLIVEDPVTIDATSIWHTEQHNIEAEAIHSKGHLTINGGTFIGHFARVSSTSVTINAVYVEAGKAEFYGGDFRTVNTRLSIDKGCEGGLLVVSNPSANNGADINELIKLDGGTYQRFAVFSLGNKKWKASDLMFGSDFLDAETGNEISSRFYDTTYIPNLRIEKHTYHVWFNSNGGKGSMSMVTLNNKNYKLPPCDITAPTGMKFNGWAVNSADSDEIYHTGENFVLKGDTVLYAAWKKNVIDEVKIITNEPEKDHYIGNQEVSILTDDSSLRIYASEWYMDEEKQTTFDIFESGKTYRLKIRVTTTKSFTNDAKVYVNGEEATVSSCDGSSILFYYDFTLPSHSYTITFGADGGTGEMAAVPDASGEYTLPVCRFAAPRGKQFKAWKVNGVEKAVGDKIVITADTIIIAVWEEIPLVMLSYHSNGGSGTMVGDMFEIGDTFVLDECEFEAPEGYKFKAWAVGSPNGEQKLPGEEIVVGNELFIYAIWEEIPLVMLSYHSNGGSGTMVGDMFEIGDTFVLDECEFEAPEGYRFKAWAIGSVNGEQKQPGEKITITTETYIYAIWEELPHDCVGVLQSGQDATCTVNGLKDYYQCNCGKCYADQNCTVLIPDLDAWKNGDGKITAAHTGTASWTQTATTHEKKYGCCGSVVVAEENHEWNNGVCSECNYVCQHTNIAVTKQNGQGATCTVDGFKDYYQCACGKLFADEARTTPITDLAAWKLGNGRIAAEHNYGDLIQATAEKHTQTELVAGVAAHYHCSVCDKYFTSGKVETTLGDLTGETPTHSFGAWKTDNDKHWKECSCGLKSNESAHNGGNATCTVRAKCSDCGKEYGSLGDHNYSDATCTKKATCSVCSDEKGELTAHTYIDGKCSCGATDPNYVPPHEHTFVEGKCECGETDPNYVAPHEHNFVEGKCACGETDPNYQPKGGWRLVIGIGSVTVILMAIAAVFIFRKKKLI